MLRQLERLLIHARLSEVRTEVLGRVLATKRRVLVEPACGAALACVYGDDVPAVLRDRRCVVVEVCGGAVINMEQMDAWAREVLKC